MAGSNIKFFDPWLLVKYYVIYIKEIKIPCLYLISFKKNVWQYYTVSDDVPLDTLGRGKFDLSNISL